MKAVLMRLNQSNDQILGVLQIFDDTDKVFEAKTLELPWLNNQQNISCIPAGSYLMKKRQSPKYKNHFHILELDGSEVKGRNYILIHHGNFKRDIRGCILVGIAHTDIDGDGLRDVTSSRNTMNRLNNSVTLDTIPLTIIELEG